MRTRGRDATVVDVATIATCFEYKEPKLQQLLDAPTQDLVKDFLLSLTTRAQEYNDTKSETLRKEVEVESTLRSNEVRVKTLKASAAKALKETEELRLELSTKDTTIATLETQLEAARHVSTGSSANVEALNARITSLEGSNRETLSALEEKATANDKLADDLALQQQKFIALKSELSTADEKVQTLENQSITAKFKEQTLAQEIELLRQSNDWHEKELKARAAEQATFRKEKNARIAELQRTNEDLNSTIEQLKRMESTLRQQLDALTLKADNALGRIQTLEGQAADADKNFQLDLGSAQRLADLQRQSAETARARLQELQDVVESVKDSAAEEIGQLQAEIETERADRQAVDAKVAELEQEVERLTNATAAAQSTASRPATPVKSGLMSSLFSPRRPGTPAGLTPASARNKGNLNFTQLVSEVNELKSELDSERRRNTALTAQLDELIQDLESRGPGQEEVRLERQRIEAEITEMSSLLDNAMAERDAAVDDLRQGQGDLESVQSESKVLRQQLRDLSAQLRLLLVEMQAREQGLETLDAADQARLQSILNGALESEPDTDHTSAGNFITQRLLLYRNVNELQEQNQQLLKLNRGLAERMEGDTAKARESEVADSLRELDEARDRIQRYQDEVKTLTTQAHGIVCERDMFRRMLSHRGPIPNNISLQSAFGQSVDGRSDAPSTPRHGDASEIDMNQTPRTKEVSDYAKLVKDLQSHLDATRSEAAISHTTLKEQLNTLSRERSEFQSETVKANGQLSLAHERHEMLQTNYRMLQGENTELQKRTSKLAESAAVQDLRTQQVAEELIEAKTLADGMRSETANLRAERDLWKRIETRLTDDNSTLRDEKARLNKLMANLQSMQNERELADSETRRKLQSRIEHLETELDGMRKRLEAELDDNKKATQRKDHELEQNKIRIDEMIAGHAGLREDLVAAKTTRQQLEARIEEYKMDLRSAEDKAQALQHHQQEMSAAAANSVEAAAEIQETVDVVAELRRELETAQRDLQATAQQVEQYKTISQATEEQLESMVQTNDQYHEEMDTILAEKQDTISRLDQRIEDMTSELSTTNKQLSDVRLQHDETSVQLEQQKVALLADVARLQDENDRQTETAKLYQEDLKAQAEIAQQAQQSYDDELVRHADAAKALRAVREEYNNLRKDVAAIRAEADAAKLSLAQGEDSWSGVRLRYDGELAELKTGRTDLQAQNKLLHEQLETISQQASALHQQRSIIEEDNSEHTATDPSIANMQEVIRYLRQEKEIVDVQHELATQDARRLRQQLDYVQAQLDDTRLKLDTERREQTDRANNSQAHEGLLQTINELNVYRESSAMLRQENQQVRKDLKIKTEEADAVYTQLQPLQMQVTQSEEELQTKAEEMKLLENDRDMWRERTQNIISKYDRVDPAELEALNTRVSDLEREKTELVEKQQEMMQEVRTEAEAGWQEKKTKIIDQAKARSREQVLKLRECEEKLSAAREEKVLVDSELAQARLEIDALTADRDTAVSAGNNQLTGDVDDQGEADKEKDIQQTDDSSEVLEAMEARAVEAEQRAETTSQTVLELEAQLADAQSRIDELESQVSTLEQQLIDFKSNEGGNANVATSDEESQTLRDRLAEVEQELEGLRAEKYVPDTEPETETTGTIATEVEKIKQTLDAQHEERKAELEASATAKVESMKKRLNDRLREHKEEVRQRQTETADNHAQELDKLRAEHQTELAALQKAHDEIVSRIEEQLEQATRATEGQSPEKTAEKRPGTPEMSVEDGEVKSEIAESEAEVQLSETQARYVCQKNQHVRNILKQNITAKVRDEGARLIAEHATAMQSKEAELNAEKEQAISALKAEQEAALQSKDEEIKKEKDLAMARSQTDREASTKEAQAQAVPTVDAEKVKEERQQAIARAVEMEGMKQKAKLGMVEGGLRTAKAKLAVVETAATDTPQKPVIEVWEIAKTTKATPVNAGVPASKAPASSIPPVVKITAPAPAADPSTKSASDATQSAVTSLQIDPQTLQARQARFGAPSISPSSTLSARPTPISSTSSFGKPSLLTPTTDDEAISATSDKVASPDTPASQLPGPKGARGGASMLPRGGGQVDRGGGGAGRGGGASRGQASGLPQRGGALGRGRASKGAGPQGKANGKRPLSDGAAGQGDEKRARGGES